MNRGRNECDPFAISEAQKYYPPHISPRITAQNALFTVEPNPTQESVVPGLVKITIPMLAKHNIQVRLAIYGIHSESMFPGLDGVCTHLSWRMKRNQGAWAPDPLAFPQG